MFFMATCIDAIALTETWLSNHVQNDELLPVGYKLFRRDRQTEAGGVLLAVMCVIALLIPQLISCTN
jgi:hypothetical protein